MKGISQGWRQPTHNADLGHRMAIEALQACGPLEDVLVMLRFAVQNPAVMLGLFLVKDCHEKARQEIRWQYQCPISSDISTIF